MGPLEGGLCRGCLMKSHLLRNRADREQISNLVARLAGGSTVADLEELLLQPTVRGRTRLWQEGDRLVAFALVDDYDNLKHDVDSQLASARVEAEIVNWGMACMRKRNTASGQQQTLDASCSADNTTRITMLERNGFQRSGLRTLIYARSLDAPIPEYALPFGHVLRAVHGADEVEELTALHRAAFGTDNMTVESRLAIMQAPQYEPQLDMVAVAPNGELAAFCICGFDDASRKVGYTDPIGTHVRYRRQGIGKAMLAAGLRALKERGAGVAKLGTGSDNVPTQRLAQTLGFLVVSESLWFSRTVA